MNPRIDHFVIDVRDRMNQAEEAFQSFGFHLTARSRHSLGSMNHLAVFGSEYLELLGMNAEAPTPRADIAGFPIGLNGLVFAMEDADATYEFLRSRAVAVQEPLAFSRTVNLAGGSREARFRVVRLAESAVPFGRVYFCEHLTPELIWRREWQEHANGGTAIMRVTIAVRDARASSQVFREIFGEACLQEISAGIWQMRAGSVELHFVPQPEVIRGLGDAAPDPAGRDEYMAAITVRTRSLSQSRRALELSGVAGLRIEPQKILVPAIHAMNVALEFAE